MSDDILEGYRDGFADDRAAPPSLTNRSRAYQFGWLNGRDDRQQKPRAHTSVLRAELANIIAETPESQTKTTL
jgi:hypothetical protein